MRNGFGWEIVGASMGALEWVWSVGRFGVEGDGTVLP